MCMTHSFTKPFCEVNSETRNKPLDRRSALTRTQTHATDEGSS